MVLGPVVMLVWTEKLSPEYSVPPGFDLRYVRLEERQFPYASHGSGGPPADEAPTARGKTTTTTTARLTSTSAPKKLEIALLLGRITTASRRSFF